MSNRNYDHDFRTVGPRRIRIAGSFVPLTGSGTVVASTVKGWGFGYAPVAGVMTLLPNASQGVTGTPGITRTSSGSYKVTFEDSYLDLEAVLLTYGFPATGGTLLTANHVPAANSFGVAGVASSFSLVLLNTSGAKTDAASGSIVNFQCILRDSNVRYNKP